MHQHHAVHVVDPKILVAIVPKMGERAHRLRLGFFDGHFAALRATMEIRHQGSSDFHDAVRPVHSLFCKVRLNFLAGNSHNPEHPEKRDTDQQVKPTADREGRHGHTHERETLSVKTCGCTRRLMPSSRSTRSLGTPRSRAKAADYKLNVSNS
ncbi:hypothetical protein DF3PB_2800002 [uncultured Defluviicoccus sp.]|uniref:Uncharacterized protein n=1 Tax=metagenome TaxID=256318 RepID=A0A380TFH8_9ZZZZ|nr:hypothetical protein DF3PB_2800002 [uncultured Defluviicoccus sp.]